MMAKPQSFFFILCLVAASVLWGSGAQAQYDPAYPTATATGAALTTTTATCNGLIATAQAATPPTFINPVIACFADSTNGFIPVMTQAVLNAIQSYFAPMFNVMMTAAVAFFGFKMAMGSLDRPNGEIFTLLFKIGGVCYFYSHATFYYRYLLADLNYFADLVSTAAVSLNSGAFLASSYCTQSGGTTYTGAAALWARWDCLFNYIFGWAGGEVTVGGVGLFLYYMFFSGGFTGTPTNTVTDYVASSGVIIALVGLYVILAIFFACMRFIHLYLMSILALSFVYCFGFVFVPLVLFKATIQYFKTWLSLIMSFVLTPMIIMAFMGMMLVAVDISVFSGTYSVWMMVTGKTANTDPDAIVTFTGKTTDKFRPLMFTMLNNQNCASTITPNVQGALGPGHSCDTMTEASINDPNQNNGRPGSSNVGLDQTALNLTQIASDAGAGSVGQYLVNVLTSFAVAALLAYIMYTLLEYLPEFSHSLVSQNTVGFKGFRGSAGNLMGKGGLGGIGQAASGATKAAGGRSGGTG